MRDKVLDALRVTKVQKVLVGVYILSLSIILVFAPYTRRGVTVLDNPKIGQAPLDVYDHIQRIENLSAGEIAEVYKVDWNKLLVEIIIASFSCLFAAVLFAKNLSCFRWFLLVYSGIIVCKSLYVPFQCSVEDMRTYWFLWDPPIPSYYGTIDLRKLFLEYCILSVLCAVVYFVVRVIRR